MCKRWTNIFSTSCISFNPFQTTFLKNSGTPKEVLRTLLLKILLKTAMFLLLCMGTAVSRPEFFGHTLMYSYSILEWN